IVARRREIEIMRLVGATNSFIRWPFFLEGLWLGILGSIVPIIIIAVVYNYFLDFVKPKMAGHFIQVLDFSPLIYQVSGLLILLGAIIGVWGSLMSVRKFLKIEFWGMPAASGRNGGGGMCRPGGFAGSDNRGLGKLDVRTEVLKDLVLGHAGCIRPECRGRHGPA